MARILRRITSIYFYLYYRLKVKFLKVLVGHEAVAYVLYNSLFPSIVLKIGGATVGKNVRVNRWLILHESRGTCKNLEIGDDVFLGKSVMIDLSEKVQIGNRCAIGMGVKIITHANFGDSTLSENYPPDKAGVEIRDDSVINWGCIINKGTRIMEKVIVLPGSVVNGTLKECSIYCGNPARIIPQKS